MNWAFGTSATNGQDLVQHTVSFATVTTVISGLWRSSAVVMVAVSQLPPPNESLQQCFWLAPPPPSLVSVVRWPNGTFLHHMLLLGREGILRSDRIDRKCQTSQGYNSNDPSHQDAALRHGFAHLLLCFCSLKQTKGKKGTGGLNEPLVERLPTLG